MWGDGGDVSGKCQVTVMFNANKAASASSALPSSCFSCGVKLSVSFSIHPQRLTESSRSSRSRWW